MIFFQCQTFVQYFDGELKKYFRKNLLRNKDISYTLPYFVFIKLNHHGGTDVINHKILNTSLSFVA